MNFSSNDIHEFVHFYLKFSGRSAKFMLDRYSFPYDPLMRHILNLKNKLFFV